MLLCFYMHITPHAHALFYVLVFQLCLLLAWEKIHLACAKKEMELHSMTIHELIVFFIFIKRTEKQRKLACVHSSQFIIGIQF